MEFTSPRNANAHRASLRLYEDSLQRSERKVQRARQQEVERKASASQFKASKISEEILKRASFRAFTPHSCPTVESLFVTDRLSSVDMLSIDNEMRLDDIEFSATKLAHSDFVVSATASTQPSPSISAVHLPDMCFPPIPDEPLVRRVKIEWAKLVEGIWKNTLVKN